LDARGIVLEVCRLKLTGWHLLAERNHRTELNTY